VTPTERFAALAAGGRLDRLPCVPIVGNTAARVIGVRTSEIRRSGELLARAHTAAYRRFGYDVVRVFTDLYVQAEAMGAKVRVPEDETAYLQEPAIASAHEVDRLLPADPGKDGCLPAHREAVARVVDDLGGEAVVTAAVTGPFTNASFLVGAETLARLALREPAVVRHLCEVSLETALRWADAILDAGASPSITDPMLSSTVVSPRQFREFGLPYLERLVTHIRGRGKSVTLHICGKTRPVWALMADTGADCLSIDNEASLVEAKAAVGKRVRLMGNVPPVAVLFESDPAGVRQAVRTCVREGSDNPRGFVVATGCSLPTETPFANIDAMVRAVDEIGWPPRVTEASA
jgi:uroporphyrinogen decarboxylase